MKQQPPFFKRVFVDQKNPKSRNILIAQEIYEKAWAQCNRMLPNSAEKTLAFRAMQESSMWLSRAIALGIWHEEQEKLETQQGIELTEAPQKPETKKPTIIIKSKKELDASLYGSMSLQLNDKAAKEAQEAHEKNMALITPLVPNNGEKDAQIEPEEEKKPKLKKVATKTTKTTRKTT